MHRVVEQFGFTIDVVKRIEAPMFNDQDDENYDPGPPPTGRQIAAFLAVLTAIVLGSFWLEDIGHGPVETALEVQPGLGARLEPAPADYDPYNDESELRRKVCE